MKNNKIRLTESQLHKVIKESVKKVLNEVTDTYDYYDHEELIDEVRYQGRELLQVIDNLAKYYLTNVEGSNDMYNSYAGKYSEEDKGLVSRVISKLGSMMEIQED